MANNHRILRRPKSCPARDAMHTMHVGLVVFVFLWIVLPVLMK